MAAVDGPRPRTRRRLAKPLVVLGAATVGGAVIEGAPADWGAVRLQRFGVAEGTSALAFAAFMAGMLAGRLVGDRLTDRHGARVVLRSGMALAACGVVTGVVVDDPVVFAVGLALAGFGASGFFPLAFSAAGRLPGVAPGIGAATVSLTARMGFLAEPVVVGGAGAGHEPARGVPAGRRGRRAARRLRDDDRPRSARRRSRALNRTP